MLWHMFKKHDKERRSIIAISDFYDKIVFVPRTIFCDGLFDLIEAADSESIDSESAASMRSNSPSQKIVLGTKTILS